ncbi:hypothetical protein QZH41_010790, partial [Actinostola sp. cb2023]
DCIMAANNENNHPLQEGPRNRKQDRQQPAKTSRKKNEFFDQLDVLDRECNALEKERNIMMFSRRSEFRKENCSLEESEMKSMNERKTEKQHLKQQLTKIKVSVDKFQRELLDVKPTPSFVQKLKEMMEDVENCIMAFKDQQRKIGERSMHQDIKSLEKKFDSWSQLPAPTTAAVGNKKAANAAMGIDLPPDVAAFEKFVAQTGGHQGGWDDYDHQLFLKLKAKHKNKDAFLSVAGTSIPGKSFDEVRQHNDWFMEYMGLKDSKRKAILEWKQNRMADKDDLIAKTREEEDEADELMRKNNERVEKERNERLAGLKDYKEQKEQEKAEIQESRQKEEQQKMKEREKEEKRRVYYYFFLPFTTNRPSRADSYHDCGEKHGTLHGHDTESYEHHGYGTNTARNLALKSQVEEYSRRRADEEEVIRAAQEARQEQLRLHNQPSADELARIQDRNAKILEEKQAKIKAKGEEIKEKQKRLQKLTSQVQVTAERDPSRLYKLTRGLEERRKDAQSGSDGRGPMLHMPHR